MLELQVDVSALPPSYRDPASEYAALVVELARGAFSGLTAFGLRVSGEPHAPDVLLQTALVVRTLDLDTVRRLAERGPQIARLGVAAPLIFTPESIAGSLDSFPLEMLEIQQTRRTLAGEDHFARLEIQTEHARLQVEREFKRMLIRLRQGLLATLGRDRLLTELIDDVAEHARRTLRGLVWLRGHREAVPAARMLTEAERLSGDALKGLRAALEPDRLHDWDEFKALYHDIERLARLVDEKR